MSSNLANDFQDRLILLLEQDKGSIIARHILKSPLGLVLKLINALFADNPEEGLLKYKDKLDEIKKKVAGLARAEQFSHTYRIAKYSLYLFAFQQFFHSSYRARQGLVLEKVVYNVLGLYDGIKIYEKKEKSKLREFYEISDERGLPDVDVLAESKNRKLIIQIRSKDITGGTTAKSSLVELLAQILEKAHSVPLTDYIILVWEPELMAQKTALINKIWERIKHLVGEENEENFKSEVEKGWEIPGRSIRLKLVYGIDDLGEYLAEFTGANEISHILVEAWNKLENWDDLWLTYAIASIELDTLIFKNTSNVSLLNKYFEIAEIEITPEDLYNYKKRSIEIALEIFPKWSESSIPLDNPKEMVNYLRDIIILKMIHIALETGMLVDIERGLERTSSLKLFIP